jgi:hypothetical protein
VIGTCGSATTFAPCALTATDIPTLNQNTTGTSANLSGTPALPNGTTATTQTLGDNTTKLATTAFVIANATGGSTGISGLTTNCIGKAGSATTITGCSGLSDNGTTTTGTEPIVLSAAGALSTPSVSITGTPLTSGGSGTTTFPLVYINDGTAPTNFSTLGTELGINTPSGYTGNFLDFKLNGATVSAATMTSAGNLTLAGFMQASGQVYGAGFVNRTSNHQFISNTAPTVASAGTSPSVPNQNGSIAFTVNVGTGGTATTLVVNVGTATAGWVCTPNDITEAAANSANHVVQTASSTTQATFQNQVASTGIAVAFGASDIVTLSCVSY